MSLSSFILLDLYSLVTAFFSHGDVFYRCSHGALQHAFFKRHIESYVYFSLPVKINEKFDQLNDQYNRSIELLTHMERLSSLGAMAAGMAHELNNPLTVIRGNIEIFSVLPVEKIRTRIDGIIQQIDRMTDIIDHLRNFSRKEKKADWIIQHISKPVNNSIILHRHNIRSKGIEIRVNVDEDCYVFGGEGQLESVFQNLIGNSCDAFDDHKVEQKRIWFDINVSGDLVVIIYRDNAGGMSHEVMGRIFEPFYTTKVIGSGTGLGMAIAYGTVHEHRGTMSVDSVKGHGTVFTIELPLQRPVSNDGETEDNSIDSQQLIDDYSGGFDKTVLIVDDEEDIGFFLASSLGDVFKTFTAQSPVEALRILEKEKVDILLTDINMPVMKGDELAKRAREIRSDLKVIYMSGHALDVIESQMGVRIESLKLIPKPFESPQHILKKVIEACSSNEAIRSKQLKNAS